MSHKPELFQGMEVGVKPNVAVEQSASGDAGAVQLWHGHDPPLRDDDRHGFSGAVDGKVAGEFAPTLARMVLRCPGQTGHRATGNRPDRQFRSPLERGRELVAVGGAPMGAGAGCQQFGSDLHGIGGECRLSGVCASRRLDDCGRNGSRKLATPLARLTGLAVSKRWRVLVLTDRGLYARWLFTTIRQHGWHPFMRINTQGQFRCRRAKRWQPLKALVARNGPVWAARLICFKSADRQLSCTLLACWQPE